MNIMNLVERIGKIINTAVEFTEVLATSKLTSAILKLFHAKGMAGAATSIDTDGAQTIKPHIGFGLEGNILRESITNCLNDLDGRRQTYWAFEAWLKKNHYIDWAPLMHFVTVQAEKSPKQAEITLNNIVDVIKHGGNEAGLKYVQTLTEGIFANLLKAYGIRFLEGIEKLQEKYPGLKKEELVKLFNQALNNIEEGLDKGEAWVEMQEKDGFWTQLFCPWRIFRMPPDVSNHNPNYHSNGGGI